MAEFWGFVSVVLMVASPIVFIFLFVLFRVRLGFKIANLFKNLSFAKSKCDHDWKRVGNTYVTKWENIETYSFMYCPKCDKEITVNSEQSSKLLIRAKVKKEYYDNITKNLEAELTKAREDLQVYKDYNELLVNKESKNLL